MTSERTVLTVIAFLGLFAMLMGSGAIWLIATDSEASQVAIISGMAGTALGGLVGMLASTRSSPPTETETTVTTEGGHTTNESLLWFILGAVAVVLFLMLSGRL